ncbi:MAG: molybdopterin dinucleotide binding domain-containing protein [Eubacterium sp.]
MHPLDAKSRHISDGELCYAYNDHGICTVQISLTEDLLPGTVIAEGVYQKEHTFGDGNFSSLLSQTLTDAGEASTLNSQTVEIRKK